MDAPPSEAHMRTVFVLGMALFLAVIAGAQNPPTLPPDAGTPTKPAETQPPPDRPAQPKPESTSVPAQPKLEEAAPPAAGDPMKMAAPKTPGGTPPKSTVDNTAYILGPEDQISVFVYQGAEFTGQHMIRPDGKVTINLVGDVQASGLTPEDLAKSVKEKLRTYVNDPDVTVAVLAVKSKKYLINGEV